MKIIDSHQHFWDLSRFDYKWMGADSPLRVNRLPGELRSLMNDTDVEYTVLVQAHSSIEETCWLLEIANQENFVLGVTGWVDLTDPKVGNALDHLQKNKYLKGIRHIWEDEPDPSWLFTSGAVKGLKEVQRRDLIYEFLVRPANLKYIPRIIEQVPDLRAVVDHIAKPAISDKKREPWLSDFKDVAKCGDLFCKISGLVTEADHLTWSLEDLKPYVDDVLELFDYDRLMFGTDWPVCTLAASYESVVQTSQGLLNDVSEEGKASILRDTAINFYRLDIPKEGLGHSV